MALVEHAEGVGLVELRPGWVRVVVVEALVFGDAVVGLVCALSGSLKMRVAEDGVGDKAWG